MRTKRFAKKATSIIMAVAMVAGILVSPSLDIEADAMVGTNDVTFFDASLENKDSFISDTVYESLQENKLHLSTPADAYITPEGVLQINYKSSTSGLTDGTYTIWGEGGDFNPGAQNSISFTIKASDSDWYSQFSVSFYSEGNTVATYNFDEWLSESGYSDSDYSEALSGFKTYKLKVPSAEFYKGMKLKFNRGNSAGTLWIDGIVFGDNVIFDNFDYDKAGRSQYYKDEYGNLPMYRPESSLKGEFAGCNYASHLKWSASTMLSNIVNNSLSDRRALQISYNTAIPDQVSGAYLESETTFSGEPVIAVTLKATEDISALTSIELLIDGDTAYRIPVKDFTTAPGGSAAASIGEDYSTIYASIPETLQFNGVRVCVDGQAFGDGEIVLARGRLYIADIYFPRYSYAVNHYFDGVQNIYFTDIATVKYGTDIENAYFDKSFGSYNLDRVEYSNESKKVLGNSEYINVYYVSNVSYRINYYYDDVLDTDKVETGEGKLGEVISTYPDKNKKGYRLDYVDPESIALTDSGNDMNVYYVRDSFPYTINYYYDGVKDDSKTETGTALFGSTVDYTDKNITGYKLDHASADRMTIDTENNIIDVYYVKASFGYTINYYYDGVKDDSKTVTGTALFGSTVNYTDKSIAGYKFSHASSASIVISENAGSNVINVYYVKDSFPYTINYYYDGIKDGSKTETGTALFGSTVNYTDKNITGYKFDHATADQMVIGAEKNIIDVYYVKDSFGYTVEYYYDGVRDDSKTDTGTALFESTVKYADKNIAGYRFVSASPAELKITEIPESNIIRVYYSKDSFPYTINYYYDGVKDDTKTISGTAVFRSTVNYADKNITGYKFDHASADSIIISENADLNVINVYYVKDSFPYTINYYYDGVQDDSKTETGTALFASTVNYADKCITGYKFDHASADSIVISENAGSNVINVYYVKDSFPYTINYYYDGVQDDSKTETGTALFASTVNYIDKNITGYKFDHATADQMVIGAEKNVIDVYYVKDSFPYTINYYYDGVQDNSKTETGTALFGSTVNYADKCIAGYKFDYASADSIVISENAGSNVINVYYVKDSFPYTINYYYDGVQDDSKTETGTALFASTVNYIDKNITGYKFDHATADRMVIGAEKNVIDVYYVKDSFPYKINYYYDGVIDAGKTEAGTAIYNSEVKYTDKVIKGYKLDRTEPEAGMIVISEDADKNVINVFYVKETVEYTVEYYYDGKLDSSLTAKLTGSYGDTVTYKSMPKDGYRFVKAEPEKLTLGDDGNVIKVYYEKIPTVIPDTGDASPIAVLSVIMAICIAGIGVSMISIRRRRQW